MFQQVTIIDRATAYRRESEYFENILPLTLSAPGMSTSSTGFLPFKTEMSANTRTRMYTPVTNHTSAYLISIRLIDGAILLD